MSRPSEPDEITSISIDLSFLPSRMIEPLPNARSIWVSAASSAFVLSMEVLSTTRRLAGGMVSLLMAQDSGNRHAAAPPPGETHRMTQCTRFVLIAQHVLLYGVPS